MLFEWRIEELHEYQFDNCIYITSESDKDIAYMECCYLAEQSNTSYHFN